MTGKEGPKGGEEGVGDLKGGRERVTTPEYPSVENCKSEGFFRSTVPSSGGKNGHVDGRMSPSV